MEEENKKYEVPEQELSYWMALAHLEHLTRIQKMNIVVKCFELNKPLSAFFNAENNEKKTIYGIDDKYIPLIKSADALIPNYAFMAENLREQGYDIITVRDSSYPQTLKNNMRYESPLVIYTKGDKALLNKKAVAVVGARNAKNKALEFTDRISRKEALAGNVIVSGFAKGTDRQALESALAVNGYSIVVLPQGITTFSSGYKQLYRYIISGHVLVMSYFPPKAGWSVGLAMARNEVIYSLADNIFVSESNSKGGTWDGVTKGIERQRARHENISIYVRMPEENEKNANKELIAFGAKAVDADGSEVDVASVNEEIAKITDEVVSLLKKEALRPSEISERLKLNWSDEKMKHFLNSLQDRNVVKTKRNRMNVYSVKQQQTELSFL